MKTKQELIEKIESEINPHGEIGLAIGTIIARMEYAELMAKTAFRNLLTAYESIGNDLMASRVRNEIKKLESTLP